MKRAAKPLIILVMVFASLPLNMQHAYASGHQRVNNTLQHRDDRGRPGSDPFDWKTLAAGPLQVRWYRGDANFGQAALNAAQAGLESIRRFMPLDLSQPIEIYIYATADDLHDTLDPGSQDWVAGHVDPALGVVGVMIAPGPEQGILMEQRIPHELMHLMLYRRVGGRYHTIPVWLREGMAVLAEIYPNAEYERALADAVKTSTLIPLENLCASFPASAPEAFLAYAEAQSFVGYLHDTYGAAGLLSLAAYHADGVACERGPERAFGVSLSELEMDWRASLQGQSELGAVLRNMTPYLVLLCLVLLVPFFGGWHAVRRKGKGHGPETQAR